MFCYDEVEKRRSVGRKISDVAITTVVYRPTVGCQHSHVTCNAQKYSVACWPLSYPWKNNNAKIREVVHRHFMKSKN